MLHGALEHPANALAANQAPYIVDLFGFTPGHDLFPGEAAIGTQRNPDASPRATELSRNSLYPLEHPPRRILVEGPKPDAEKLIAHGNGECQITRGLGVTMETALRLVSVRGDLRRIQIQHRPLPWGGKGLHGEINPKPVNRVGSSSQSCDSTCFFHKLQAVKTCFCQRPPSSRLPFLSIEPLPVGSGIAHGRYESS